MLVVINTVLNVINVVAVLFFLNFVIAAMFG
jgi:hypothetical protein